MPAPTTTSKTSNPRRRPPTTARSFSRSIFPLLLLSLAPLCAAEKNNTGGTNWGNAGHWNGGTYPAFGDNIVINNASQVTGANIINFNPNPQGTFTVTDIEFSRTNAFSELRANGTAGTQIFLTGGRVNFLLANVSPDQDFSIGLSGAQIFTLTPSIPGNILVQNADRSIVFGPQSAITGTAALTKTGVGTIELQAANAGFSGGWILDAGTIAVGHNNSLGSGTFTANGGTFVSLGNRTLGNEIVLNGHLTIGSGGQLRWTNTVTGPGSLILPTGGDLRLDGNNTFGGGISLQGGRIRAGSDDAFGTGGITVTADGGVYTASGGNWVIANDWTFQGGTLQNTGGQNSTLAGNLLGNGVLQANEATLTLTGTNAPTLALALPGGSMILDGPATRTIAGLSGNAASTLDLGSTILTINQTTDGTFQGSLLGSGSIIKEGDAELAFTQASPKAYTGSTTINAGTLRVSGPGQMTHTSAITINGGELNLSSNATYDFGSSIGGAPINLNGGILGTGSGNNVIVENAIAVGGNAGIFSRGGGTLDLNGPLTGSGLLQKGGGGTLTLNNTSSSQLGFNVTNGALILQNFDRTFSSLASSGGTTIDFGANALTINQNADTEIDGVLTGSGNFVKSGSGELRLDGVTNNLTGNVTVQAGTLAVRESGSLGTPGGIFVQPQGTFRLRVDNSAVSDVTYDFGTPITLNGGRLERGGGNENFTAILASDVQINRNSTIASTSGRAFEISGDLLGGPAIISKSGSGSLLLTGQNSPQLGFDVRSGLLDLGGGPRTFGFLAVDDDAALNLRSQLTVNQAANSSVQGQLTGPGGLTKTGPGELAFTQSNKTFRGPLVVSGGTLRISDSGQPTQTSSVTINQGGTIDLSSDDQRTYQLGTGTIFMNGGTLFKSAPEATDIVTLRNPLQFRSSSQVRVAGESVLILGGNVSGSGDLNKEGTGFLVLRGGTSGFSGRLNNQGGEVVRPEPLFAPSSNLFYNVPSAEGTRREFNDIFGPGGIVKQGDGRLNLYGVNTFRGPLRLEGGRLDISTSESLGNPSRIEFAGDRTALSVSGGSVVEVNAPIRGNSDNLRDRTQIRLGASGGSTLILNQPISGNTDVRFSTGGSGGGGLVVLNARSKYQGHTTINNSPNGIVRLGINNALPTNTRLRFGNNDQDTGRLDLAGFNQTVASLEKNNDEGATVGGIFNSSDRTSTLTVNQSRTSFFDGPFAGRIDLTKRGSGTLTWVADSFDWDGTLSVEDGAVFLNGIAPTARVNIGRDGTFGGTNLVQSVTNQGTFAPGNSPGFVIIQENFTQTSSGRTVLDLEGTGPTDFDQVLVFGNSNLAGTLQLQLNNFIPVAGDEFNNLITTFGTTTGSFDRIVSSPLVDYQVQQGQTVSARVRSVNFASPRLGSLGPNEQQIANFLQGEYEAGAPTREFSSPADVLMQNALAYNRSSSVRRAYRDFAADEIGALPVLAFQSSNAVFSWLQGRIDGLRFGSAGTSARGMDWFRPSNAPLWEGEHDPMWRDGALERPTGTEWSVYASGLFRTSQQDETPTIDSFLSNSIGGAAGLDFKLPSGFFGFFGGYENTSTQFQTTQSQIDTDTAFFGTHLTWLFGDLNVTGALAYAYNAYSFERRIPSLGETATGKTDGNQLSALLSTSYDLKTHGWLISPMASLQFSQLWVDGFRESGSAAAQEISSFSVPSLQLGTGIRIARVLPSASVIMIPEVRAGYRYEALGGSRNVTTQFVDGGSSFGLVTQSVDRNAGVFGAGLTTVFQNGLTAYIDYQAEVGDSNQVVQTVYGGFRWFFPGGPSLADQFPLPDNNKDWYDSIMDTPPVDFLVKNLGFNGRFQVQYANLRTNAEGNNVANPGNFNELFIRRWYFGLRREIVAGLEAEVTLKYVQDSNEIELFDASLTYQPVPWFGVRAGYDRVPFGWEEDTSSRVLKTIERSPATRFIVGLGGDNEVGGFKNNVAVFGEIDHRLGTAYYDFAIAYPSDEPDGLFQNSAGNQLYYYARAGNLFATPIGDFNFGTDFGFFPTDFRRRGGASAIGYSAHLQYNYLGFQLVAEFMGVNYEDDPGDPVRNPMAFYITPSYFVTPQFELVGQFAWLDAQGAHDIRLNQVIPNAPTNYPNSREYNNLYYWYAGFNYYLRGNTVKFQAGLQWSEASGVRSGSSRLTSAEQTFGARCQLQILW